MHPESDLTQTNPMARAGITGLVAVVSLFGVVTTVISFWNLSRPIDSLYVKMLLGLVAVFMFMARWSVRLPSGASWRPAMAMVTVSIFLLPMQFTPLVALPGLIWITYLSDSPWWKYPLTLGHVNAGLYTGAIVYRSITPSGVPHLPEMLPGAILGLLCHLIVNRFISAGIVAHRNRQPLWRQFWSSLRELNWVHCDMYLLTVVMALVCEMDIWWGLIIMAVLQFGFYRSILYYSRMQLWRKTAWTDGLTNAENRAAWDAFVQLDTTRRHRGTLAVIDMDDFKVINDNHGHAIGDALLRDVATTVQGMLRDGERLFRYGGDEFVLYLHSDGDATAQRIEATIESMRHEWRKQGIGFRASVGLASYPYDATDFEELFNIADSRMYSVKEVEKGKPLVLTN